MIVSEDVAPAGSDKLGFARQDMPGATFARELRGSETILLAEDYIAVRTATRQVLERFGYHVLEATSPQGAIDLAVVHKAGIHLLLTDVVMPEMNGPQVADQIRTLRPEMRVLFMSGYAEESIVRQGLLAAGTAYIAKPFTPDQLAQKVRQVIDGR